MTPSDPLSRLLHALNHPMRRRILVELAARRGSANSLSRELGVGLSMVTYHLRHVLHNQCGVVEVVDGRKRGGSCVDVYTVRAESFSGLLPWDELPRPIREFLREYSAIEFLQLASASLMADSETRMGNTRLGWSPIEVDWHGWLEISSAATQFEREIDTAVIRSQKRARRRPVRDLMTVIVGIATFKSAARPSSGGSGRHSGEPTVPDAKHSTP